MVSWKCAWHAAVQVRMVGCSGRPAGCRKLVTKLDSGSEHGAGPKPIGARKANLSPEVLPFAQEVALSEQG